MSAQSLAELRVQNATPKEAQLPAVVMGFGSLQGFELMQRGAKLLASSSLVPKEYVGNIPNCVIALNMANRLGADPLLVMQNLYVVHGRPGWSAKFLIATFNQCGRFTSVRYEQKGKPSSPEWGYRAWATEKSTGERIEGSWVTWKIVNDEGWNKKSGSKWLTIPDQMFMYRSAAWMINTHAPELSMGLSTVEELRDVLDAQPDGAGNFSVDTDALRESLSRNGEVSAAAVDVIDESVVIEDATETSNPAAPSYAEVAKALQAAGTLDALHIAADQIRDVENKAHQHQLNQLYAEREAALK